MSTIYAELGLTPVINASGTLTRIGGTLMLPEVMDAMARAATAFVPMDELEEAAGRIIADITGAEAGYVTSGAAAGLTLAVAACVAGLDPAGMDRLPDTSNMRNEVIIQRGHRNSYDHAIRAAGVKTVEVGYLGFPGAGGTYAWQIEAAINERTAAIACPWLDTPGTVPLPAVADLVHRHGLPVIVDASAALPPVGNLRRFIAEGADVVVFSGGKALRGPQASGIVAGRATLIESMALQHQDMDVLPETWTHRQRYIDSGVMSGPPHQGVGRGFKVGKEEVVGLITALRLYVARDHEADRQLWMRKAHYFAQELGRLPHVRAEVVVPAARPVPHTRVFLDPEALHLTAADVVNCLLASPPRIAVGQSLVRDNALVLNPMTLENGEAEIVTDRLKAVLQDRGR